MGGGGRRRGAAGRMLGHMSASVCAMIAGPEMFTPQGGNSLTVKKLSGRSDQKFSPSLSVGVVGDRQRHRDQLRHRVALERRDRRLHRDGDEARRLADRDALQALVGMLGDQLAEAVLGLAGHRHERVAGVHHRLHGAGRAALDGDAVELAVHGDGVGGDLLRGAVVPVADDLRRSPSRRRWRRRPRGCRSSGRGRPSCRAGRGPRGSCRRSCPAALSSSTRNCAHWRPISSWSSLTCITASVSSTLSNGTSTTFVACRRGGSPGRSRRARPRW